LIGYLSVDVIGNAPVLPFANFVEKLNPAD
jgi:hypothetical protein